MYSLLINPGAQLKPYLILAAITQSLASVAAPVEVTYSGVIDRITYTECAYIATFCNSTISHDADRITTFNGDRISLGDRFEGNFSYETTTVGVKPNTYNQLIYSGAVKYWDVTYGGVPLTGSSSALGNAAVINSFGPFSPGYFELFANALFETEELHTISSISLFRLVDDPTLSLQLPDHLSLTDFLSGGFAMSFYRFTDGLSMQIYGQITTLSSNPNEVPEPPTIFLLGAVGIIASRTFRAGRATR